MNKEIPGLNVHSISFSLNYLYEVLGLNSVLDENYIIVLPKSFVIHRVGSTAAKENCQELVSAATTFSSGSSMKEEEAMKEFRLKFRLAELKEKAIN
ncbi:hypothetical protein EB796_000919 [Bugula neritina]|uniref:Uncharacterized protein n=1 Tax=Bugula neritina TaxID=10212 RepID=A0A7J7KRK2_BUGNE|nr:hypothetical protein EB796_000919 [Bugula neritina]